MLINEEYKLYSSQLKFLLKYFKPFYVRAIIGGIALLLSPALIIPTPLITMYLIDNVLPAKNSSELAIIGIILIMIFILRTFFNFIQYIYFMKFNERVIGLVLIVQV